MYCSQCGTANAETASSCEKCGATLYQPGSSAEPAPQAPIQNYLVPSILVTLCCCLIPGIVAIVYAAQVNALVKAGDYIGARRCSRLAHIWCWVGFGLGLVSLAFYAAIVFLGVLSES